MFKKWFFKSLLTVFIVALSNESWGSIELGVGSTSAMGGRIVPALMVGVGSDRWHLSGFATGVQNEIYYQSTYGLGLLRIWKSGDFLGGMVTSGIGLGTFVSQREFSDSGSLIVEQESDFGVGPAFRAQWFYMGSLYINLEWVFGLRGLANVALNSQDMVQLSLGVSL